MGMAPQAVGRRAPGSSELEQKLDQITAFGRRHRGRQCVGHQGPVLADLLDFAPGNAKWRRRPGVAKRQLGRRLGDLVTLCILPSAVTIVYAEYSSLT